MWLSVQKPTVFRLRQIVILFQHRNVRIWSFIVVVVQQLQRPLLMLFKCVKDCLHSRYDPCFLQCGYLNEPEPKHHQVYLWALREIARCPTSKRGSPRSIFGVSVCGSVQNRSPPTIHSIPQAGWMHFNL